MCNQRAMATLNADYCTRLTFNYTPKTSGNHLLSVLATGTATLYIDDNFTRKYSTDYKNNNFRERLSTSIDQSSNGDSILKWKITKLIRYGWNHGLLSLTLWLAQLVELSFKDPVSDSSKVWMY
jgi:hypothetical protein